MSSLAGSNPAPSATYPCLISIPCRSITVSFTPSSPVIPREPWYHGVRGRPISSLAIPHLSWYESWERNGQAIGQCGSGPQREDPWKAPRRRHAIPDGLALCEKVLGAAAHHRGQAQGPGAWSLSRSVACAGPRAGAGQPLPGEVRRQPARGEAGGGEAFGRPDIRGAGPAAHRREPRLLAEAPSMGRSGVQPLRPMRSRRSAPCR